METIASPTGLSAVSLEVDDLDAARRFYSDAFGLDTELGLCASDAPTSGFRGFTLTLRVDRPATVDGFFRAALAAGATTLKPVAKSLWGYGGSLRAPDGTVWQIATSAKKDAGPDSRRFEAIVLLLGVEDVKASKQFYVDRGLTVGRGFGGKYVEFTGGAGPFELALYKRRGLAKVAGTAPEGSGSHRLVVGCPTGPFTDPDGFVWEAADPAS